MVGEQLMRLLETLDGISLDQDMFELRARRKKAAAGINSLMDTHDSNIRRSEREAKEREAELVSRLSKVEEEGERLGQEVVRLAAASRQEVTVRRKENKMVGEQLMRLLETLDGISLDQDMFELRARRKKVAARINSLMDTNDSNIQVTTENLDPRFERYNPPIIVGY